MHVSLDKSYTLQVRLFLRVFSLHFIHEVEIRLVKMMHPHVPILTTAAVSGALGVHGNIIERAEVTPHTANLLAEDLVVKSSFELSLSRASSRHVHRRLTAAENHIVFHWGDGGTVERRVCGVRLEDLQAIRGENLVSR